MPASSEAPQTNLGKIIHVLRGTLQKIIRKLRPNKPEVLILEENSQENKAENTADFHDSKTAKMK